MHSKSWYCGSSVQDPNHPFTAPLPRISWIWLPTDNWRKDSYSQRCMKLCCSGQQAATPNEVTPVKALEQSPTDGLVPSFQANSPPSKRQKMWPRIVTTHVASSQICTLTVINDDLAVVLAFWCFFRISYILRGSEHFGAACIETCFPHGRIGFECLRIGCHDQYTWSNNCCWYLWMRVETLMRRQDCSVYESCLLADIKSLVDL